MVHPKTLKIRNLKQIKPLTKEWFDIRKTITTGTQAATVLGYESLFLRKQKFNIDSVSPNNKALAWGRDHEDMAIKLFEKITNLKVDEVGLMVHEKFKFLGATPDGITSDGCILEIKCPLTRSIWGPIPFEYWIQMQMEMEVFDLNSAYFFQVEYPEGRHRLQIVKRDKKWINEVIPKIDLYWKNKFKNKSKSKRKRDLDVDYINFNDIKPILNQDDMTAYIITNHKKMGYFPKRVFDYNNTIKFKNEAIDKLIGRRKRNTIEIIDHICEQTITDSQNAMKNISKSNKSLIRNPIFIRDNNLITSIPLFRNGVCYHYIKSYNGISKIMKQISFVDYVTYSQYEHKIFTYNSDEVIDVERSNIDKHLDDITLAINRYPKILKMKINDATSNLLLNMKIQYPKWDHVRSQIAKDMGEFTTIWGIRNKDKTEYLNHGINNIYQLEEVPNSISEVFIKSKKNTCTNWVSIVKQIELQLKNSRIQDKKLAYFDFETANNIIFMIGIILDETYYEFTAKELNRDCEREILKQFTAFDKKFSKLSSGPITYVHWSAAERNNINTHLKHNPNRYLSKINNDENKWFDLAKVFKKNCLIFPKMDSFKLKSVVSSMNYLGLIKSSYSPEKMSCMNGAEAASYGLAYYDSEYDNMNDIKEYNKIDCQVLSEIMNYLLNK